MSDLEHGPVLTVPGHTRQAFRTSLIVCVAVGVLGLVAGALISGQTVALVAFGCVGLVLGAGNSLMIQRTVLRQAASDLPSKGALVRGVGARLAVVTAVALALALLFFPTGLGAFIGLALWQVINTIVGSVPALKELRK